MKKLVVWGFLLCMLTTALSISSLAAEQTYVYDFNETAGAMWSSTSQRSLNRSYKVFIDGGEAQTYSMYILTSGIGGKLRVYSPEMEFDTGACTSAELTMECWHLDGNDPEFDIKIYYSTDKGATWEGELPITVTKTEKRAVVTVDSSLTGPVYEITTGNICDAVKDKVITNLKIVPFGSVASVGAFRFTHLNIVTKGDAITMKQAANIDMAADKEPVVTYVPEINDSPVIQNMIDKTPAGGEVTIGVNPRTGDRNWEIGQPISVPSDITVYIDNATLRLADGVFCNIFHSANAYAERMTAEEQEKNIKIIGKGSAVLDGGKHNGKTEKTAGYPDIVQNTFIFFRNVDGFEVKNLTMKDSRYWANTYIFCENGIIEDITFDARNTAPNQDGIDLRIGCNNITINNIYGVTGDDTIALTALLHRVDTRWMVEGKDTAIHHVDISNVRAMCAGGHGVIRLLAQDGNKIYDVNIDNVYDLSIDEGGPRCAGLLRIGEHGYATVKQNEPGDIDRVTVSNVTSRAKFAVYVGTENVTWEHLKIRDVKAVEGSVAGGKISLDDMPSIDIDAETTEKVEDTTPESIVPENEKDLEGVLADLETVLVELEEVIAEYSDSLSDAEKNAILNDIDRINKAIAELNSLMGNNVGSDEVGCGSAMTVGAIASMCLSGACIAIIARKKKD